MLHSRLPVEEIWVQILGLLWSPLDSIELSTIFQPTPLYWIPEKTKEGKESMSSLAKGLDRIVKKIPLSCKLIALMNVHEFFHESYV